MAELSAAGAPPTSVGVTQRNAAEGGTENVETVDKK